jgi:transcriptional regulator with XRE-family HTH domain
MSTQSTQSTQTIGTVIAKLRKEKGATQEELAKYTQVSTQAVSKWENGGVPDTELLPKIADYFAVSIDALFGRNIGDYGDFEEAITKQIKAAESDFSGAFDICWTIERSFFGQKTANDKPIKELQDEIGDELWYSQISKKEGFTAMGINKNLPYFLIVPESANKQLGYFEGVDYVGFFKDFSDKAVFDSLVFLYQRENDNSFTPNLLVKKLGITEQKAVEIIQILQKYSLIGTTEIEIDDTTQYV